MASDWIEYVPPTERRATERRRTIQRRIFRLRKRSVLSSLCVSAYLALSFLLLFNGIHFAFGMSLLMVVGVPVIAWSAWWLVWKEYHS